jgi:hypothetical protein
LILKSIPLVVLSLLVYGCRQVDELQEEITKLKAELETKVDIPELPNLEATEVEQARQQELIADLKLQLEQVKLLYAHLFVDMLICSSSANLRKLG